MYGVDNEVIEDASSTDCKVTVCDGTEPEQIPAHETEVCQDGNACTQTDNCIAEDGSGGKCLINNTCGSLCGNHAID